jgi:hypothetical protein
MIRALALAALLACLAFQPVHAQTAGGSCSTAGWVASGESGLLVCNSSDYWELAQSWYGASGYGYVLQNIGNDTGSCTTAKTGELIYTGSTPAWEYCNGSSWQPL